MPAEAPAPTLRLEFLLRICPRFALVSILHFVISAVKSCRFAGFSCLLLRVFGKVCSSFHYSVMSDAVVVVAAGLFESHSTCDILRYLAIYREGFWALLHSVPSAV